MTYHKSRGINIADIALWWTRVAMETKPIYYLLITLYFTEKLNYWIKNVQLWTKKLSAAKIKQKHFMDLMFSKVLNGCYGNNKNRSNSVFNKNNFQTLQIVIATLAYYLQKKLYT